MPPTSPVSTSSLVLQKVCLNGLSSSQWIHTSANSPVSGQWRRCLQVTISHTLLTHSPRPLSLRSVRGQTRAARFWACPWSATFRPHWSFFSQIFLWFCLFPAQTFHTSPSTTTLLEIIPSCKLSSRHRGRMQVFCGLITMHFQGKIKIRSSCFLKNADLNAEFRCHRIALFIQIDAKKKA